jgi:elongation factor 1 alpha-like protein
MPPKSGFSRTRNIDYDDDDVYDDDDYYDEGGDDVQGGDDGMTADDKEQMRVGTIRVREALGDMSGFTSDEQIQEALWHYYYDVGKSVSYLKNKLGVEPKQEAPKKEKAKAVSRFDQAATVADQNAPPTAGKLAHFHCSDMQKSTCPAAHHLPLPPMSMPTNAAVTDFFWDVPWGNVPSDRLGEITVEPPRWRGGLLGGSKLAALAAKRRKEREDAEAASAAAKATVEADAAIAMLDKLSVQSKENKASSLRGGQDEPAPRVSRYPVRKRSPSPQPALPEEQIEAEPEAPQPAIVAEFPAQRATASMFASTLCGSAHPARRPQSQLLEFTAPYASYKDYDSIKAFGTPSPDDIVRAAQAKGAGGGRH